MTSRPGLQTRPGNVHKHPGKVVTNLIRKRRSPAEVAAEKAAIALKRSQEEERKAALVEQVDEIERRLRGLNLDEMTLTRSHVAKVSTAIANPIEAVEKPAKGRGRGAAPRGTGRGAPSSRGSGRGAPPSRGSGRGAPPSRGTRGRGGGATSRGSRGRGTGGARGARQTGASRTPSPAAVDVRAPSRTPEPEPRPSQNWSSSEGLPAKSNSPSRADQGLASSEMPSSDPLTPLPEIEDFQSDVDMREEYQKDPDGCRQDQGAIAEPGVECELEDDAVRKAVEGESTAGDQPGEGANLVVNNGNTSNAKGTSHQISHLEEDISNQGTVPIAKVRVRPQPRKKNPDVNAASSEGPLNTVEGQPSAPGDNCDDATIAQGQVSSGTANAPEKRKAAPTLPQTPGPAKRSKVAPLNGGSFTTKTSSVVSASSSNASSLAPSDSVSQINTTSDFRGRTPLRPANFRRDEEYTTPARLSLTVVDRTPGRNGDDEELEDMPPVNTGTRWAKAGSSNAASSTAVQPIVINAPASDDIEEVAGPALKIVRQTSEMEVCVERNGLLGVGKRQKSRSKSSSRSKENLPHGIGNMAMWNEVYITTIRKYFGGTIRADDPWEVSFDKSGKDIQAIYDKIFAGLPHDVKSNCIVFEISRQRVYDWRHALGKMAFKAVSEHLDGLSATEKIVCSKAMLIGNRFIYRDPDAAVGKGAYQSKLVLKVLGHHYTEIEGALSTSTLSKVINWHWKPYNALIYSAIAVGGSLRHFAEGNTVHDAAKFKFSKDIFYKETMFHVRSLGTFKEQTWTEIVSGARAFTMEKKRKLPVLEDLDEMPLIEDI